MAFFQKQIISKLFPNIEFSAVKLRKLSSARIQGYKDTQQNCSDIVENCTNSPVAPSNQLIDSYQAVSDGLMHASNGELLWGFTEGKLIVYFSVMAALWFYDKKLEREHRNREMELEIVQKKIKDLYGPLYGNRLVRVTAYQAALGKYNDVDEYLKAAEQLKNPEMIQKWRKYYHTFILPLDQKAEELILNMAHLIADDGDLPKEFIEFLQNFARFKFIMEDWKNTNGSLESCEEMCESDFLMETNHGCENDKILSLVARKYKKLRARQQYLSLEANENEYKAKYITKIFSR